MRGTMVWIVVLTVGAAGGGFGLARHYLARLDGIVSSEIHRALATHVPEWDVSFSDLDADPSGVVRLVDVSLRVRGSRSQLVHVSEMVVSLDRRLFAENQILRVREVELVEPTVYVTRRTNGTWNWQELSPPPKSEAACPEVRIVDGTIVVHCERTSRLPETEFQFRSVSGRLVPSGHRRFLVKATTDVDHAGALAVDGSLDLKSGAWELRGDVAALDTEEGLLDVAAGISPELRDRMSVLSDETHRAGSGPQETAEDNPLRYTTGPDRAPVHRPSGRTGEAALTSSPEPSTQFALPELGVRVQMDVHFELSRKNADSPLDYQAAATIHDGAIVNAALPVPLYGLQGRLSVSADEIVIEELSASNEGSLLSVSGRAVRNGDQFEKDFALRATNIELDRRVREYVHNEAWRKMYDQISPAGRFNLDVHVVQDAAGRWRVTLNDFTALRCSLLHAAFQYPITDITGSIRQEDDTFHAVLDGMAGERPITLRGFFKNPGPEMEIAFQIPRRRRSSRRAVRTGDAVGNVPPGPRCDGIAPTGRVGRHRRFSAPASRTETEAAAAPSRRRARRRSRLRTVSLPADQPSGSDRLRSTAGADLVLHESSRRARPGRPDRQRDVRSSQRPRTTRSRRDRPQRQPRSGPLQGLQHRNARTRRSLEAGLACRNGRRPQCHVDLDARRGSLKSDCRRFSFLKDG